MNKTNIKEKKKQYCNKFKRILKWFTSNKSLKHTHRKKTKLSLSRDQTEQGNIFHAAAVTWIHLKTDFRVPAILHFKLEYFQMTNHTRTSMSFHSCRQPKHISVQCQIFLNIKRQRVLSVYPLERYFNACQPICKSVESHFTMSANFIDMI